MKRAIYFNQEYNPENPPRYAICLTYDPVEGLKIVDDRVETTLSTTADVAQTAEIQVLSDKVKELEKTISILKVDNAGGVVETDTSISVTVVDKNISSPEKDIVIYPVTIEKSTTIEGKSVTVDGATLNATPEQNASLIVGSSENINIENVTVKGEFPSNTNQIDVRTSKKIVINDAIISADGYNGLMLVQDDFTVIPDEILIENVKFESNISLAAITICAVADNANITIRNCTFNETGVIFRFRNSTNAKGVNVLIENCHFNESIFDKGNLLVIFEENGNVLLEDGTKGQIWGIAKDLAGKAGITLLKKGDEIDGVVLEADETGGSPTYVKRVFPYLLAFEDSENRFGKDKMTITFRNCTYGPDKTKLVFNADEYKNFIGANVDSDLICILRQSGRDSFNQWNENFQAEHDRIYVPYDDSVKYMGDYIEEIEWTQTNKNSDCYPTIIFE